MCCVVLYSSGYGAVGAYQQAIEKSAQCPTASGYTDHSVPRSVSYVHNHSKDRAMINTNVLLRFVCYLTNGQGHQVKGQSHRCQILNLSKYFVMTLQSEFVGIKGELP